MDHIVEFLFLDANKAFLVASLFLVGLVIVEVLFALIGFNVGEAAQAMGLGKPDLDKPDFGKADIDKGTFNIFTWLNAGQVPFVIFLVAFLSLFSISGYVIQWIVEQSTGGVLHGFLAVSIALIPGIFLVRNLTRAISMMIPREETTAVFLDSLEGCVGPVTIKTSPYAAGQARVKDPHGTIHYIRILPEGDEEIEQGTDVVLLSATNHVFTVRKI
jgi:hypothetical protein